MIVRRRHNLDAGEENGFNLLGKTILQVVRIKALNPIGFVVCKAIFERAVT
jgi:hypothetical protein